MSRKVMAAAVALAAVSVAPVSAQAASYAVSINQITNFNTWVTGGSLSPFTFTFSNDAAALNTIGASNVDAMDAPGACVGTPCSGWQNQFVAHSAVLSDFSYGDARILSVPNLSGTLGAASAIGETYATAGLGYGTGGNTLTAVFNVQSAGTQLHFGFDADLLLQTISDGAGQFAAASTAMQISLTGPSGYQFLWAPNGGSGGITGGTEHADAFSLNWGISGTNTYANASGSAGFHAVTDALAVGSYTMNITMTQTANVSAVPVPAAAWLLGSGLLGLAGWCRRSR